MIKLVAEMHCVMSQIRKATCTFYATHHGTVLCKVLCYQIGNGLKTFGKELIVADRTKIKAECCTTAA